MIVTPSSSVPPQRRPPGFNMQYVSLMPRIGFSTKKTLKFITNASEISLREPELVPVHSSDVNVLGP